MIYACETLKENIENNSNNITKINRYFIVLYGKTITRNIGGSESAREITCLGPPLNILSRIDDLTKKNGLKMLKVSKALILTSDFYQEQSVVFGQIEHRKIYYLKINSKSGIF